MLKQRIDAIHLMGVQTMTRQAVADINIGLIHSSLRQSIRTEHFIFPGAQRPWVTYGAVTGISG